MEEQGKQKPQLVEQGKQQPARNIQSLSKREPNPNCQAIDYIVTLNNHSEKFQRFSTWQSSTHTKLEHEWHTLLQLDTMRQYTASSETSKFNAQRITMETYFNMIQTWIVLGKLTDKALK